MEDKVDSIKCITAWKESWRLRVKIVRLWFYTDPLAEDNEKLLHMILMDQNATVKEPYISIFVDDLYVGGAFCMTSFSVVPNIGIMKMTHHRFKLLFQKGTTVIPEPSLQIRDSGFSFCSMFEILEKKSDYHYLIDFIGVITSVRHQTEVDYYGKKLKLMILEIYADGKKVQCNVFGKCCDSLDNSILMKFERLPVIVLQSFKIKVYGDEVCLQNVLNVSDILINPDLQETVRFLERLDVASYHFFSFKKNIHGSLVSYINHDSFDWRRIRTIQLIQQKMENGFFFVAGKIKQVVGDGHWWSFSCVCGHSVQKHSHDNFYCQVCDKNIDNVIASYRVKIIVEDSTSSGIFVLLNAAATKLFGKSCSVALDQFQKELNDFNHPLHHAFFEVVVGKELILKIEFTELIKEEFGGMFKVITILDDRQTGLGLSVDSHINDTFQAPAYTPICEADFHYSEIEKYTSRIPFDASIDANNIDEMLLDSISTGFNCATPDPDVYGLLLGSIVSVIKEQKWWYSSCLCGGVTRAIKGSFFCDMCELECVDVIPRLDVASYHFFSFKKNIHGSLVSYINHDSFDWRRIRTIQLIQQKMENGFFFVAGKIKQVVGDGHWWSFSCVCGHSVQKHSHENFYCQVCDKNIDNVIASYRVKIIVEDSTSSGIFVLLNAAATKLFGKSCSVALDQFQKELNDFNHPLHHAFFEVVVGKELILKIEFTELIKEEFGGMFKVITILDDRQTGLGLSVDSHINDTFQAPAYTPICEADFHYSEIEKYTSRIPFDASIDANNIDEMLLDSISTGFNCATPDPDVYGLLLGSIVSVIKEQKWWYSSCLCGGVTRAIKGSFFCDMCELECVDVIPSYRIKVIISHANGSNVFLLHDREITQIIKKRCSALLNENPHLKQTNTERKVPPELGNYLIQRKMVFMIDPRPLGYQYNTSVYMVHRICDDMSLVNLFKAAASMHDKKEYFMDIGCLSEATVNMEKKMDDSLLDEEVDCASSMALPDSSSYGVAEHELQNAFKICMQHQSDPTSMH
ncbi:hypothetical protein Ahy_B03g062096 [Arachis hypogaea]|uniref:Replication factor A C-terminal domain-containing protein n=1 Tax=Arachis hypogaea TaxID=3818 RepID=A0A444ZSY6_ARAHY|nr:hypothetical protein Ahy_B03g062096 [Arachis hypogaea]